MGVTSALTSIRGRRRLPQIKTLCWPADRYIARWSPNNYATSGLPSALQFRHAAGAWYRFHDPTPTTTQLPLRPVLQARPASDYKPLDPPARAPATGLHHQPTGQFPGPFNYILTRWNGLSLFGSVTHDMHRQIHFRAPGTYAKRQSDQPGSAPAAVVGPDAGHVNLLDNASLSYAPTRQPLRFTLKPGQLFVSSACEWWRPVPRHYEQPSTPGMTGGLDGDFAWEPDLVTGTQSTAVWVAQPRRTVFTVTSRPTRPAGGWSAPGCTGPAAHEHLRAGAGTITPPC